FKYHTMQRDETAERKVDPYHLVFRGGQFYLIGYAHEREAVRVFRLSRIKGKVGYATKSEHDFTPPEEFERRDYADLADWQLGETAGTARIFFRDRIAWLIERDFSRHGTITRQEGDGDQEGGVILETTYASDRELLAWVLRWRQNAEVLDPPELRELAAERINLLRDRHINGFEIAKTSEGIAPPVKERRQRNKERASAAIRPERFGRLVTLAGMLIGAAKEEGKLSVSDLCTRLELSEEELRDDVDVLNVVNFGGGTYVLYAEVVGDEIEVDSQPYGDNFARPARLLPLEAKALTAAIDLFGSHLPQEGLVGARKKIVDALGHDPSEEGLEITPGGGDDAEASRAVNEAITSRRVLEINYYKEHEDEFTRRRIEPYRLQNGAEGWYVKSYDLGRDAVRHFKLDRIREAAVSEEEFEPRPELAEPGGVEGWMTDGAVPSANVARVWVSPERARWMREERNVVAELADGAVVVELAYAGLPFLVREMLRGAGDYVVLEPAEAREAIARELSA
ncbi:MAG TPA: WYL domain-containing protein, partial [Solirubrobacterales bacterium]|nr:WYL domain-containing protein [Solirubrobacterales bacterium]